MCGSILNVTWQFLTCPSRSLRTLTSHVSSDVWCFFFCPPLLVEPIRYKIGKINNHVIIIFFPPLSNMISQWHTHCRTFGVGTGSQEGGGLPSPTIIGVVGIGNQLVADRACNLQATRPGRFLGFTDTATGLSLTSKVAPRSAAFRDASGTGWPMWTCAPVQRRRRTPRDCGGARAGTRRRSNA